MQKSCARTGCHDPGSPHFLEGGESRLKNPHCRESARGGPVSGETSDEPWRGLRMGTKRKRRTQPKETSRSPVSSLLSPRSHLRYLRSPGIGWLDHCHQPRSTHPECDTVHRQRLPENSQNVHKTCNKRRTLPKAPNIRHQIRALYCPPSLGESTTYKRSASRAGGQLRRNDMSSEYLINIKSYTVDTASSRRESCPSPACQS